MATAKPMAAHATGRSTPDYAAALPASSYTTNSPKKRLRLNTSSSTKSSNAFGNVYGAGASPASSTTYFPPRTDSRAAGSKMSASNLTSIPAGGRPEAKHAKLHKRGGSGSSLPGSPIPTSVLSQGPAPLSTYDESSTSSTPIGSMPKIRPYLRKMSTKEDTEQGRLDLSKSISENHALSGLGIQDLNSTSSFPRNASDVSFTHASKRTHTRNTSGESNHSTSSLRPSTKQPFVHPMRQTPRPYTPPHGHSFEASTFPCSYPANDDERNESSDVLTDDSDFRLRRGGRRSVSISSAPVIAPTPLSQSHTASDLGLVPKLTGSVLGSMGAANSSQTNLSIKSGRSGKSSKSRGPGRSRRNTDRSLPGGTSSFDTPLTSTSPRTSLDKAFSFSLGGGGTSSSLGRRSDTDPLTRDQKIEAARRKFEEKERKAEERVLKRRETDEEKKRRKSEASERLPKKSGSSDGGARKGKLNKKREGEKEKEKGVGGMRVTEEPRASNSASFTRQGTGLSEKGQQQRERVHRASFGEEDAKPGRFSTWLKTRLLSCGGKG